MQLGFVGLGKMGRNMVHRIHRDSDHQVVAFDFSQEAVDVLVQGPPVARLPGSGPAEFTTCRPGRASPGLRWRGRGVRRSGSLRCSAR